LRSANGDAKLRAPNPCIILSGREVAIALLVARGLRNRGIAAELGYTIHQVASSLHNIYRKTGVSGRTNLIIRLKYGRRPTSRPELAAHSISG
jgi:two-component system nitrate/nitrite response regulator NarP